MQSTCSPDGAEAPALSDSAISGKVDPGRTFADLSGVMVVLLQGVAFKYQDHTVIVELAHNDTIEGAHPTKCCTATYVH